jgi:putative ATPase
MHRMDLFTPKSDTASPLADRMRPVTFDDVIGQDHLTGEKGLLRKACEGGLLYPFVLWGPPGTGKTTLANIVAKQSELEFFPFSAVLSGMKEVKDIMARARKIKNISGKATVVFIDEIHRFNKAQQDAFLPYVERGDIILLGATTENPSFEIRSALLSRLQVYITHPLDHEAIALVLDRAIAKDPWIGSLNIDIPTETRALIAEKNPGDARSALTLLETALSTHTDTTLLPKHVLSVMQKPDMYYDKDGEQHYNIISALHKSMRNSDVDAALYWLARMLEAGEDPLYVARRLIRFASEDVGLASPQALSMAVAAKDTVHFIGMPEGKLALAQLVVYLSTAPKSNAVYKAYKAIEKDIAQGHVYPVPLQIRNAPTKLMRDLDYGKGYQYAHDHQDKITDMDCLPEPLLGRTYYTPTQQGFEKNIEEWLKNWKELKKK